MEWRDYLMYEKPITRKQLIRLLLISGFPFFGWIMALVIYIRRPHKIGGIWKPMNGKEE